MTGPLDVSAPIDRAARGDGLLLGCLVLALAGLACLSPIRNFDYWYHLAAGEWIVTHLAVPHVDPFSFTSTGTAWVDHEWLFQVIAYAGQKVLGHGGLVIIKAGLLFGLCLLLVQPLRRAGHGPSGSAVLLVPTLLGASFRFDVRPELTTLLLLPVVLYLVILSRDRDSARPLYAVPPIVLLWANLHAGVILAPAVLGAGLAGTLAAHAARRWMTGATTTDAGAAARFGRRLAWLLVVVILAVGINPFGFRIYAVPFELSSLLASLPWPNLEWVKPEFADFPFFWIVLPLSILTIAAGYRRADPLATPGLLLAACLAVAHLRNIGVFFMLLPFALAGPVREVVDRVKRTAPFRAAVKSGAFRPGFVAAAVAVIGSFPLLLLLPPRPFLGIGIAPTNDPGLAVDFLEREGLGERLYNDVRFGGYLIWRRFPEHRVFIDGRNEIYPSLMHQIAAGMNGAGPWGRLLERHGIDAAFLRYPPTLQKVIYPGDGDRPPVEDLRAFSTAYFPKEKWALVYWDDQAMIFLRRLPKHEDAIARLEYRAFHPDDWQHLFAGVLMRQIPVGPILADIERKLREDPSCLRARGLYTRFAAFDRSGESTGSGTGGGAR